MPAHANGFHSHPFDRLSPIARRYLQMVHRIPLHPHTVRRQTGLYEAKVLSITPVELVILVLSVGVVIGILLFICLLSIQHCVAHLKRRFGYDTTPKIQLPIPCRRPSCDRRSTQQRSDSYMTAPEALRSPASIMGISKQATYGALESEGSYQQRAGNYMAPPEVLRNSGSMMSLKRNATYGTLDTEGSSKHATFATVSTEGPYKQAQTESFPKFVSSDREPLMGGHAGGNKAGYYEGQTPWDSCDRQEQDGKDTPSSGRPGFLHRDDCNASCGTTRRRSVDRFGV